jgi:hypothetical protein
VKFNICMIIKIEPMDGNEVFMDLGNMKYISQVEITGRGGN